MTPEDMQQRVDAWVAPLAGGSAVGLDCRHDREFAELRAEVAKLEALTGGAVAWERVLELGGIILGEKSKDLLAAAYSAHALDQLEGLRGLSAGLTLWKGLIDSYWDGCFPSRLRARSNALQWYLQRTTEKLVATEVTGDDREALAAAKEAAEGFAEVVRVRFGEAAPTTRQLQHELQRLTLALADEPADAVSGPEKPRSSSNPPLSLDGDGPQGPDSAVPVVNPQAEREPGEQAEQRGQDSAAARLITAAEPWLSPITPENPAGVDARYEPQHEAIRSEVAKRESVSSGDVDWEAVVNQGEALIKQHSKDLLIAAYVAWGLFVRDGLLGLANGLAMVCGLIDTYWESLFPAVRRNTRARANAVTWLLERVASLAEMEPKPSDQASVDLLEAGANRLHELAIERFDEDHRPSVRALVDFVQRLKMTLQEQALGPLEQSRGPGSEGSAPRADNRAEKTGNSVRDKNRTKTPEPAELPQLPAVPADSMDDEALDAFLSDLRATLLHVAEGLRRAEPASAVGFRLGRVAMFLRTIEPPETETAGRTIAPPPPDDAMQYLQELLTDKNWPELLAESEDLLSRHVFSLDCYRYACIALENLGADYAAARRIAVGELAALLLRVPELLDLCFSDGTSFASDVTRGWIRTTIGGAGATAAAAAPESGGESAEPLAAIEQAKQAVGRGDYESALASLQAAVVQAGGGRQRFRLRLALAESCAAAGAADVAEGVYATLAEEIREKGLEDWEPELATQCLVSYYRFLKGLSAKNEDITEKLSMMYQRLCRLDPKWAMQQSR